jgi:hypothetical protein
LQHLGLIGIAVGVYTSRSGAFGQPAAVLLRSAAFQKTLMKPTSTAPRPDFMPRNRWLHAATRQQGVVFLPHPARRSTSPSWRRN